MSEIKLLNVFKTRKIKNTDTLEQENIATIVCRIPYAGVQREKLIKNLVKKLKGHINKPFKSSKVYRTKN